MIYLENNPYVDFETIGNKDRKDGLSGFIRAKNEGEYIYQVIESWIKLVDELVVVFNDCSDNTEFEIERAIKNFGGKIKAFKYLPKVYPQGSNEHIALPPNNPHSLVNYYNYALSKTTCKFVVKIDGDIIFDQTAIHDIKSYLNKSTGNDFFKLYGVNLIDNKGQLFIPSNSSFCGMNGDLCIFKFSEKTFFKWRKEFEYLDLSQLTSAGGVFSYYHLKFVKKDMGFGNYLLSENPNSRYVEITKKFVVLLYFKDIETFLRKYKINLKQPEELGIKSVENRDFIENYKRSLGKINIKITKSDYVSGVFRKAILIIKLKLKLIFSF